MPRTPCRTRCWPPGRASAGSRDAPRSAPGCTGSPPTGASTRAARPAGDRPRSGTCPGWNRPSRPGSARSSGSQPFPDALLGRRDRVPPGPEARYEQTEVHLAGLRDRPSGPAASPARRPHPARRPRIPRQRGGRHAGLDRRIGQQRPQAGARQPAAPAAGGRRPRTAARRRLTRRGRDRGEVRPRLGVRRSRRAGGPADRTTSSCRCRRCPSNTRAGTSWPASAPACSARAAGSTSCRREPTASRRSAPTCATPAGLSHGTGLYVLTLAGDRICAMTRFENSVLPWFGLPRSLPAGSQLTGAGPAAGAAVLAALRSGAWPVQGFGHRPAEPAQVPGAVAARQRDRTAVSSVRSGSSSSAPMKKNTAPIRVPGWPARHYAAGRSPG